MGAAALKSLDQHHALEPIRLRDGALIQSWVHPGEGIPLLFLYGLGCGVQHWKYQLRHFQQLGRLTIHLDYRGHGASSLGNPQRPMTIRALSHDLAEVLDHLHVDRAVVLGQSMGGTVALQFAHDHSDRVAGMVLQGSPGRNPLANTRVGQETVTALRAMIALNKLAPDWARGINQLLSRAAPLAREIVRIKGFNPSLARTDDIDEYIAQFFAVDPNLFYELADDLADFDVSQLDHLIECPALVLAGAKDDVIPVEECRWLAKRLPAAELEVMQHGSHCPHLDDPPHVNRRIEKFLGTYDI